MTKKSFATYFGLVVLALSLFASTAFAINNPGAGTTQVVVTNSPAQPVPMVGVIKDSDAAARHPFQWKGDIVIPPGQGQTITVTSVPANQRLVIEYVSGYCQNMLGNVFMTEYLSGVVDIGQWLPGEFANGNALPAATGVQFYVEPGAAFLMTANNLTNVQHTCNMTATGHFVSLP
jgi:hypothetical protein